MYRQIHGRIILTFVATALLFSSLTPTASAVVIYDEAISGDLPNDRLLAKLIALPPITDGSLFKIWTVIGSVGEPADPVDD